MSDTPGVADTAPYWRLAVQHDAGRSYWQIGTYGIDVHLLPNDMSPSGKTDHLTDIAADANWQFVAQPKIVTSDILSAHATLISEAQDLAATNLLSNSNRHDRLQTARADLSYSIAATYTPSVQVFQTSGSSDPALWAGPADRPESQGVIAEIAYVPFGKPHSRPAWGNIRLALQYVCYTKFDGETHGASANNTLYASLWARVALLNTMQ